MAEDAANSALYLAAYFAVAALAGANLSLLVGSLLQTLLSGRTVLIHLAPALLAAAGLTGWLNQGGDPWLAFAGGAALLGAYLLHQEHFIEILHLPAWRRALFNLVVGAGIAGLLALPAIIVTMGFSFAVLGQAKPSYLVAAGAAAVAAGVFVLRAGRARRAEARKEAMEVVQAFE